jgi:pterin-4a-carbinolamine dehydratase
MNSATPKIIELQYHPRWENQWKTVTVYLTTFDIGNQISELDLKMAKEFDGLYEQ